MITGAGIRPAPFSNKMNRLILSVIFAALLAGSVSLHAGGEGLSIATVDMMNKGTASPDSHSGLEMRSRLELMAKYDLIIPASRLGCPNPVYARIKKMADGRYFLMYHNGRIGSNVFYNTTSDLLNWSAPTELFHACPVTTPDGDDERRYSSADAIVLQNGDILAYVAARANHGYRFYPQCNYISMKRSRDNGKTWGEEEFIYHGTVWEPFMLQLPSGKIQCYFTDTEPKLLNSGTSIVESDDNGYTWTPDGLSECYKVIRQYKYTEDGTKIYTDQMPCARLLNNGKTYLGFLEARLSKPSTPDGQTYYKMSVVRGHGDWKHLGDGEEGPEDRNTNVIDGAAGYVAQFPSGETVLSCNMESIFRIKLGNCDGTEFQGENWSDRWMKVLSRKGYWGATEIISSHEILATMHCTSGIQLSKYYLNHMIEAAETRVDVDGDNSEWKNDEAWFIGSESEKVQTCVRAAQDGENVYFGIDRIDSYLHTGDDVTIYVSGGDELDSKSISVRVSPDSGYSWYLRGKHGWKAGAGEKGIRFKCGIAGTVDDDFPDTGYFGELSIPRRLLPKSSDGFLRVMVVVHNGDTDDSFTWADSTDPSGWMLLKVR